MAQSVEPKVARSVQPLCGSVNRALGISVSKALDGSVSTALGGSVVTPLLGSVSTALGGSVVTPLLGSVSTALGGSVDTAFGDSVGRTLGGSVDRALKYRSHVEQNLLETRWILFVGCLTSQQHASVSQGGIYSDNWTCCHIERQKLQIKLSTSPSHSILTPGQPVPALAL